jgi:PBP1b-binding outer membrane lipoprotein LpoB
MHINKSITSLIILLFLWNSCTKKATPKNIENVKEIEIHTVVDSAAEYPGGKTAMTTYILKNLNDLHNKFYY